MAQLLLRCPTCGEEEVTESPCPYTGWAYASGWVVKCPRCGEQMTPRPDEKVRHVCECEKVLNANGEGNR